MNQTDLHCRIDSSLFSGAGDSGIPEYYHEAGVVELSSTKSLLIGEPDAMLDMFPLYAGNNIGKVFCVFG
ncbi:hypothetical protein [Burkholderia cepacia]|uniref:hypothetical protein n=1 Tax=Burkholderia cepacia TaxID=292 RepID=UPI000758F118|nr:hypothetical protein [Burkholderia cepacia]KWC91619.1 hypothetical protein WL56_05650 [Burkholderia cepacia]